MSNADGMAGSDTGKPEVKNTAGLPVKYRGKMLLDFKGSLFQIQSCWFHFA